MKTSTIEAPKKITATWLFNYFNSKPANTWCTNTRDNGEGQRCAFGHLQADGIFGDYDNNYNNYLEKSISNLFNDHFGSDALAAINNGPNHYGECNLQFKQETPKERVLAACEVLIKAGE